MFAGKPLANMVFKILSEDVVSQGIFFAQDQKLGHYFKIAPRTVWLAQGYACILGSLTQTGVTLWMLGNIDDVCSSDQANSFTCPNGRTVFSSSVIWGLVGPKRLYSVGKIYSGLLHFFWIGALMPILTWAAWKYTKKEWLRKVNWPLIFSMLDLRIWMRMALLTNSHSWNLQRPSGDRYQLFVLGNGQPRLQPLD